MTHKFRFAALVLLLPVLGCNSEDPRLPSQLYEDAVQKNQANQAAAAKVMMQTIVTRFPESEAATRARKDLYLIDSLQKKDLNERQQTLKTSMKRIMDALTRYKAKKAEYPASLTDLVPEYLEQVPETPWGHPFLYRAYVGVPIEDVTDRRGNVSQRFNTKLDHYYFCCLGTDFEPGGEGMASDVLVKDGELVDPVKDRTFPPLPTPQPLR